MAQTRKALTIRIFESTNFGPESAKFGRSVAGSRQNNGQKTAKYGPGGQPYKILVKSMRSVGKYGSTPGVGLRRNMDRFGLTELEFGRRTGLKPQTPAASHQTPPTGPSFGQLPSGRLLVARIWGRNGRIGAKAQTDGRRRCVQRSSEERTSAADVFSGVRWWRGL